MRVFAVMVPRRSRSSLNRSRPCRWSGYGIGVVHRLKTTSIAPFPTNDNDRYPDARPTGLHDYLAQAHRALAQA